MHGSHCVLRSRKLLVAFIKTDRRRWHDRRNRAFEHQLRLPVTAQQHAEIIKPRDHALQLDTVDQKDRYGDLFFAHMVEEYILQVLLISGHISMPF